MSNKTPSKAERSEISKKLDTRGDYCPTPIIKTAKTLKNMKEGEVLEVFSDDPGFAYDLPAWCRSTGNDLLLMEECKNVLRGFVRKGIRRE